MKITGVKLARQAGCCIVALATDAGITGIGIGDAATGAQARKIATAMLVGMDPRGVTGLWQQMAQEKSLGGGAKAHGRAIAVLDLALWDLKSRAAGEPLWKTLGGARPRANAYASSAGRFRGDEELAAWFTRMARDYGLRGGKLRVGLQGDADLRRLGRMRAALERAAPEPALMIDAARRWPARQAIGRVRAIERQFDLTWIEGVSGSRDARGLKRLSDAISGAVCVGVEFAGIAEFEAHFRQRSADVFQIDIGATGITAALQLADAAYGLELPVTLAAVPGNIHALVAGVMPNCMSVEILDPEPPAWMRASDVRIEDGRAVAGDAPGNGLRLEPA